MDKEREELLKEFTADQISSLDRVIEEGMGKPGSLIPVMEEAQTVLGFLPTPVLKRIARGLDIPLSGVYGVATFYSFFTMTPRGKHTVRVCLGTACYVLGGKRIAEVIEKEFDVEEGGTTKDRLFTFEAVRCLGACGLGPVVVIDDDVHGRVKPSEIKKIMQQYT